MLKTIFTIIFLFTIGALQAQLKEFEVKDMEPPETQVVQGNTKYPDNAMILVYSSIQNLNFRSSIGGINQQKYNRGANRYEILISPQKQILFAAASGFIEQRLTLVNPSAKEIFYYVVEEKVDKEEIPVFFQVEPNDARLFVNNKPTEINKTVNVPLGKVDIRLEHNSRQTLEKYLDIRKEQVLYKLVMQKKEDDNKLIDPRDGQTYKVVEIGDQVWMAENLAYNSGSYARAYNTVQSNVAKYGYLYHWATVRNVCPPGWHLPSDEEWTELTDYLGGKKVAGEKMKSTDGWNENGNGTNESGFSGLPGGIRNSIGSFYSIGKKGLWWSSTENTAGTAWNRGLNYGNGVVTRNYSSKPYGFSVRCLKD